MRTDVSNFGRLMVVGLVFCAGAAAETLYNGIVLPDVWPPPDREPSREPMPLPYLDAPPAVIPIDVGRQLFVDDFLIAETTLTRTHYKAEYYPYNPVLTPDKPWESEGDSQGHAAPTAMVFSDGVWYDAGAGLFKMWYMAGYCAGTAYATSRDGIHWEKPELDVVPGTNLVHTVDRDSGTVWFDPDEKDPARRYKMIIYFHPSKKQYLGVYFSPDGIHWSDVAAHSGPLGDRSTVFYNPFRKVWVYNIRAYAHPGIGRYRRYWENPDVIEAAKWQEGQPPLWVGADTLDAPRADVNNTPCELYNLDAAAYESLLIGLFSIWRGQPENRAKPNELCIGYSRDGFHWQRPVHEAFIPVSENVGDWNWANIQSAGGCCLIVGDKLYFYVSGRKGVPGSPASGVSSTGLATLRRDGFASMGTADSGTLTTRPVVFQGRHVFVNAKVGGELKAAVLDEAGAVLPGFAEEDCTAWKGDSTRQRLSWKGGDLTALAGKPVRFRFSMRDGELYAFWVSADEKGSSGGYYAGGLVEK